MAKDPAILFYTSDFLTGTMFLSDEQTGKYIRLLCAQHQKGRLSEKDMLNICKTHDQDIFDKFEKDSKGFYFNERLENEAKKRKAYSESRRKNRTKKVKPEEDMLKISNSYDKHMENENVNENRDINVLNAFKENVIETAKELSYSKSIFIPFLEHWTERDFESGGYAWQVPETFVIKSRLKGWKKNGEKNKVEHNDITKLLL